MQAGPVVALKQTLQESPMAHEPGRLDALTSLRFVAALMIVLLHFDQIILQGHETFLSRGLALQQGVSFFFVLSGFVLYYRYPVLVNLIACKKFFVARFARIYPAYIISTILFMVAVPSFMWCTAGNRSVWLFAATATMIQSLIPKLQYFYAINTPGWSISTEFVFYLLFPLLIYRWKETRFIKLAVCVVATLTCLFLAHKLEAHPATVESRGLFMWLLYVNPFVRCLEFMTGMLTANLFLSIRTKYKPSNLQASMLQVASLLLVAFCLVACKSAAPLSIDRLPGAGAYWVEGSGGFLAYALLVFGASFSNGVVAKMLSHPALIVLGEISFSVYLLHWMLMDIFLIHLVDHSLVLSGPVLCAVYLTCVMTLSWMMHELAEKPLRSLIKNALSARVKPKSNFSLADAQPFFNEEKLADGSTPLSKV